MTKTEIPSLKISVRALVDFFYRSGDLDLETYTSSRRMMQGTRAHQKLQKNRPDNYQKEVSLSYQWQNKQCLIQVRGRIDGLYLNDDNVILEEIKTTNRSLEQISSKQYDLWWGQAKVYAAIYCRQNDLAEIMVQLAVYNLDSKKETILKEHYMADDLNLFFKKLLEFYLAWAIRLATRIRLRNKSLQKQDFPFGSYRRGQRALAVQSYHAIRDNKQLLVQAPTGIGKTMAVLFPALKAIAYDLTDRIFYLTARTTGKDVAAAAAKHLLNPEIQFRIIILTSKERICFKPDASCHPSECEFAKGFWDRLSDAVNDIFPQRIYTRELIEEYSRKHQVCPFEFSLELSLFCDCIICDYNYAFDPRAYLRRFFERKDERYSFLVDEAHNLVDRARSMFSAELEKADILTLRRQLKDDNKALYKVLGDLNKSFLQYRKEMTEDEVAQCDPPVNIIKPARAFLSAADNWLAQNHKTSYRKDLIELYFQINAFIWCLENYSEHYRTIFHRDKSRLHIKLFCLNPAQRLAECLTRTISAVFFSATLSPFSYFQEILGCNEDAVTLNLPSAFPPQNLKTYISPVSTRYKHRQKTLPLIAALICRFLSQHQGNTLIFFPSYKYMTSALQLIDENSISHQMIVQKAGMTEAQRTDFLKNFSDKDTPQAAFAVMGGVFGEGIDLIGNKLTAAIIIGVGLPGIDQERELIKNYYPDKNKGYNFAYTFPGITRVLQACGRVIRTAEDKGAILLIDDRFLSPRYKYLLPPWWKNIKKVL